LYAIRKANQVSLGSAIIPTYLFDKAKVIAGFNCDFLGGWVNATENAKRYSANRVPTKENPNNVSSLSIPVVCNDILVLVQTINIL
jgi:hypothetical protein